MNIDTIDCAMLQTPFEAQRRIPKYKEKQSYLYSLAKAFEFYESAV